MPGKRPRKPGGVHALGDLHIGGDDPEGATERALDQLRDQSDRLQQQAVTPTVHRVTMTSVTPLTNVRDSFYTDGTDAWYLDGNGNRIQLTAAGAVNVPPSPPPSGSSIPFSTVWRSPAFTAGSSASTRGPNNDEARALYMGRAPIDLTSIIVRWNQTAGGTIVYAEFGIATSPQLVPGSTSTLTIVGFVDVATEWGSAAIAQKTITISPTITAGTEIWVLYTVNFSAGTPTITVSNVDDPLNTQFYLKRAATRLSTNLNTPLAFVNDNATTAWIEFGLP